MNGQRWRDRLLAELYRQRLPSDYVSRLVDELTDHAADLFTENPSMEAEQNADARLGTPEHVAAVAKVEFQRRTFAGRHPVLTFLVGPIVGVAGIFTGTLLILWGSTYAVAWLIDAVTRGRLSALEASGAIPPVYVIWILLFYASIIRFVPFVMSTWVFARLGRRSGLRRWGMAACGVIALIAVFFSFIVTPETAQRKGLLMFGFTGSIGLDQILQAVVPLALGAWMLWRSSDSRPKNVRLNNGSLLKGPEHGKPAVA